MRLRAIGLLLKLIWIVLAVQVLDGVGQSTALGAATCEVGFKTEKFAGSLKFPRESLLDAFEEASARAVLNDKSLTTEDRWSKVLDIYFESRISRIPTRHHQSIRWLTKELRMGFRPNMKTFKATTKGLLFPDEFRNTPIPAIIIAHEFEHLMRTVVRSNGFEVHSSASFSYSFNPFEMYFEETSAISAEWEMIRLMTESDVSSVYEAAKILEGAKDSLVVRSMADFSKLNRAEYLAATRSTSRYSAINVLQKTSKNVALPTGITAAVVGSASGFVYGVYKASCALIAFVF